MTSATFAPGAIATLEPTPTPGPTMRVTLPPKVEADVAITQQFFKAWTNSIGDVQYQIIVEVKNNGNGPADISSGSNDYTVYDTDDAVLETGTFSYAFPQILAPGATGYYVDSGYLDDVKLRNVGEADPDLHYGDTDESTHLFPVSKVRVSAEPYGDGLQVSGIVKNDSSTDADEPIVGVIFFNANEKIIGALYENTLGQLDSGDQKGFKTTYPGTPPLKASSVAGYKAIAYNYEYFF